MNRRSFIALPLAAGAASSPLFNRLHAALQRVDVLDTHEHFPAEAERVKSRIDFFTLVGHYTVSDVISAGASKEEAAALVDEQAPEFKRWAAFEPYWKYVRNTGYAQALEIAIRDVYGISEISAGTLGKINAAIAERNRPGIYRQLIREKAGIRAALNDAIVDPADSELLLSVRRFDHFLLPKDIALIEKLTKTSITSFKALKNALSAHFERAVKRENMVAVKCALAYQRDLTFESVPEVDAARSFESFLRGREKEPPRKAVDHLVHFMIQLADAHRIPIQIHTGMLAGNGRYVERTRPTQLVPILQRYPRVPFDLFHAGYPYTREFGVLVKQFPNAYGDLCWLHIISPAAARQALREMLDSVPANKIMGFGGDYRYPELSYGHLVIARKNIATVLAERVEAGLNTDEEAVETGRWLLHDNPARLFIR